MVQQFARDSSYPIAEAPPGYISAWGYCCGIAFFSSQARRLLFQAYRYFRWLDDLIDEIVPSQQARMALLARETALISAWYDGQNAAGPEYAPEQSIYKVIQHDRANGYKLESMVRLFLDALRWDASRRHHMVSQEALDRYSMLLGQAYAQGLLFGLNLDPYDRRLLRAGRSAGTAAHLAHMLRDFEDDLSLGYVNVSREDQLRFGLQFPDPDPTSVVQWKQHLAERACAMFEEAKLLGRDLPTFRARMLFRLTCVRYRLIAERWLLPSHSPA